MDTTTILRASDASKHGDVLHARHILASDREANRPQAKSDSFRGFIAVDDHEAKPKGDSILALGGDGRLSRRQLHRLMRLGFVPIMAGGSDQAAAPAGVMAMLPFTSSAHEHTEPAFTVTATPGVTEQQLNPLNVPANGWLRNVMLQIDASGGTIGTGVANADYPFSLFSNVLLQEVNGGNIVGPGINGYDAFLINLLGGYAFRSDPRDMPAFVGTAPNPVLTLRVPAEVSQHDGLAALSNQNASALFQLLLSVAALAQQYTTVGTVAPGPHVIKGWLEAWTLPTATDRQGRPQMQGPPLVGTGQYWSKRSKAVLVGANTVEFTRLGNLVRLWALIARDATNVRVDTVFPDPMFFNWDGFALQSQVSQRYMKQYLFEKVLTAGAAIAGVFALPFNHGGSGEGRMGNEDPNLWLGTTQASRLEISGNSAVAGQIQVLTNEVAPIEANPAQQYTSPNRTGQLANPASIQAAA